MQALVSAGVPEPHENDRNLTKKCAEVRPAPDLWRPGSAVGDAGATNGRRCISFRFIVNNLFFT
jgi:hypothetical protein